MTDRRFWRLLVFRGWFSLANGISQTVQNVIYPKEVLGFGVGPLQVMRVTMQVGQLAVSPLAGRASDAWGNRPVLVVAQACVSASLLFFILAGGPDMRWLLLGAWVLFAAYVAHNICLPNLVLKLSPTLERPAYIATNDALASLLHAGATIGGGLLFDWLRATSPDTSAEPYRSCLIILAPGWSCAAWAWSWRRQSTSRAHARWRRDSVARAIQIRVQPAWGVVKT